MTIKPIDLQTNIGQMHEVGKGEQARTEAVVEQQHLLEKESDEKSRLVNTRLDESKKGENTVIKDEQTKKERKGRNRKEGEKSANEKQMHKERSVDERMGNIIDVLK